ncbi:uncharacterized protein [Rutidosis leptorrhynchoides]|uniref:uncharacterized protein n=1 Tax=Rutidosis leptorrhynchoides TaxID=125765 RepID=UPI003A999252
MAIRDQDKTAFHTPDGIFCYIKMPFGLKNAGATYQRVIDKAFKDQICRNVEAYVDDIVIKSHTEESMLKDTLETFESLRKVNMKLNPKKCTFGAQEGKFLGHIVTQRGIKENPKKIQAIDDMVSPKNKERSAKFERKIGNLNKDFMWTEEAETAFQDVKRILKELPTLTTPIVGEMLILYMAVLAEAISSVLIAEQNGVQMPIYFELHTDGASSEEGVGAGLALTSPEGEEHTYALKFCFYAFNNEAEYEALLFGLRIASEMRIKHLRAYVDSQIVAQQYLQDGTLPVNITEARRIKVSAPLYVLENGVLYRKSFSGPNLRCLAPQQVIDVVKEMHEGLCAQHSVSSAWAFCKWAIDIVGSFPRSVENAKFLVVAIDFFTKWVEARLLARIMGENIEKFAWNDIVCRYGLSNEIVSDNCKQFADNPFKS